MTCPVLDPVPHAIQEGSGTAYGTVIFYRCQPHHETGGDGGEIKVRNRRHEDGYINKTVTCGGRGTWSYSPLSCDGIYIQSFVFYFIL